MSLSSLIPLPRLGYLRVSGADADGFLQGQFSNDLRRLTPDCAQLSSYNSPKGRMLAVLHLFRASDAIWLEVHREVLDAVLRRLRLFVMRSKVSIDDAGPAMQALGCTDAGLCARLGLGQPPELPLAFTASARGISMMRRFGAAPRWSLHGPAAALEALAGGNSADVDADAQLWQLHDIEAGVPTVHAATSDAFVPQMCNLDLAGGIAFDKGCYTGQEIVARLHYLGTPRRRMYLCRGEGPPPAPGTPIFEAAGETQPVGTVVDAVADGEGCVLSAVLQTAHAESLQLRLGTPAGPALGLPRPYAYSA